MRTFAPSPPVRAFFEALEAAAKAAPVGINWTGGVYELGWGFTLPTPPPPPTDPVELAFYTNVCLDLYHRLAALRVVPAAPAPAAPAVDYGFSPSAP